MDNRIDAEEIGALLDGRVAEPRRSELLTRLEQDDEGYDLFADTAAVLREAEEGASEKEPEPVREYEAAPATTKVIPLRPRRAVGWRNSPARWMAMAAALAALALVPVLRSRMNESAWRNPERMAAALASRPGAQLPREWGHEFNTTRGGNESIPNSGVAAQVGALHLDLEVAVRSSGPVDTATVAQLARTAAATLQKADETGPGLVANSYSDIAQSTDWSRPAVLERLAAARTDVVRSVDPDYFALGAWTEAARLAARGQDAAFFRRRESHKALERAAGLEALNDRGKRAATRLRIAVEQGKSPDWPSLGKDLDELQAALAR